ncbi:Vesicle transport protein S20 [Coemansia sp. RSA 1933]|nr:Vesicle transport protein S20 [Coemansia sp. RSA 1933]
MVNAEFETFEPQLRGIEEELDQIEGDVTLLEEFSGTRDEHQQLSASIREQHRTVERLLEHMELSTDTADLLQRIGELRKRAHGAQRSFRWAMLRHSGNATREAQREREQLLSGATTAAELRKRKARTGNAVLGAAAEVTTALQQTVGMMNDEIDKSVGNIAALTDSSATLKRTKDRYVTMADVLKTSARLIRALENADAADRWLMLAGLVLFALVAFNILRKRTWIPGLSSLFALVRYLIVLAFRSAVPDPPSPVLVSSSQSLVMASSELLVMASGYVSDTISTSLLSIETATTSAILSLGSTTASESLEMSDIYVSSSSILLDEPDSNDSDPDTIDTTTESPLSSTDESDSEELLPPFTSQRHYTLPVEHVEF